MKIVLKHPQRHSGVEWEKVQAKLPSKVKNSERCPKWKNLEVKPDVVGHDPKTGEVIFFNCSPETPKGRVSLCYDRAGLHS